MSLPTSPAPAETELLGRPPERLYRAGMLRRFGWLYFSLLWFFLRRFRLSEGSAEHVRAAAERGPLVYVLHTQSALDWLALNTVLNHHRLPLARFTNGVRSSPWAPIADGLRDLWTSLSDRFRGETAPDPVASGWLLNAVLRGVPTALFLNRKGLGDLLGAGVPELAFDALVEAAHNSPQRIQLVPIVVAWSRHPDGGGSEVTRWLLGTEAAPSPIGKLLQIGRFQSTPLVQAGQPVDLAELVERFADEPPARKVRAARVLLRRYLYRESQVIRGPRVRPYEATRRMVLASAEITRLVTEEAAISHRSEDAVRAQVSRVHDHIAARFSFRVVRFMDHVARVLWDRIYSGVDIREEDVERVKDAMRRGSPVLVPCHRSHLDYILMSSTLYRHGIVIPHVVAGENLSFWPVGALFRRCGAFFIKRSFKGDRVFPVVFERYLRQLLRDGFPVEFFIEGTRSRSGKLLPPKLGVLGMVMDAAAGGREDREVTLLPIAISYEQIAEERSYASELKGEAKQKEDLGQVVRASKVLRKRYGRVYIRVGEPVRLAPLFAALDKPWAELDREHRRETLERTGERLMARIAANMVVLPTGLVSMALLAQSKRGIHVLDLHARIRRFFDLLVAQGATAASSLAYTGQIVAEALRRFQQSKFITQIKDEEGEIYQVVEDRRITLEYYKNGLLYFVAPTSLMAAAIGAVCLRRREDLGSGPLPAVDDPEVSRLFQLQVFLLRYEFTVDPELTVEALEQRARASLQRYGALVPGPDGGPVPGAVPLLGELAGLTRNLLESYWLVLRAAKGLRSRDLSAEELPKRVYQAGRGLLAVDELRRPEALSLENIRNAVTAFREEGVLQVRVGGSGLQFDDTALRQYEADLRRLLGD